MKKAGKKVSADDFRGTLFNLQPDYTRPALDVPEARRERIRGRLEVLYGKAAADQVARQVERLMRVHYAFQMPELIDMERRLDPRQRFTERDVILITYGDMIVSEDRRPLRTLADFTEVFFRGIVSTLHILPFYPYSSDRGFSVLSYEEVDPRLGSWEEIAELESNFKLMFDAVFNHVSAKSYWFQQFLNGDPEYDGFFTVFSSREAVDQDYLRLILRPRTTDLLTEVATIHGTRYVWTTFSPDQIDLNFKNPKVLLKVLEILLYYVRRGADLIRLDAVTYLWSELGTSCAHLRQTHEVVKLFRDVLDVVSPHVALVTETNVPHRDNITYFGDGHDEAQMVYNFALPPLVLDAFLEGDARQLSRWVAKLEPPSDTTSFLNLLDSHDGIGVLGARGILSEEQIGKMCERTRQCGGFVSKKANGDGTEDPYELNTTWFSVLSRPGSSEPVEVHVDRFIASRAIALVLRGVPGIYLPSMFGSKNDLDGVAHGGSYRSINRTALQSHKLFEQFEDPGSLPSRVARRLVDLLEVRVGDAAFHPHGRQQVLAVDSRVLAVLRTAPSGGSKVLSLINVSRETVCVQVAAAEVGLAGKLQDLLGGEGTVVSDGVLNLRLKPYQVAWLREE
ncbi:MAG: sugar phosphorylase [Acidobacteria bacterium]|nr:sugar phosphorylase [Acidobacteriota bacterium]